EEKEEKEKKEKKEKRKEEKKEKRSQFATVLAQEPPTLSDIEYLLVNRA
ncbi:hypothetical protein HJC23_006273, partial [Cyclotella cryptica]